MTAGAGANGDRAAPTGNGGREPGGERLLDVEHLEVSFFARRGTVQAVRDVSFTIDRSEVLGLVGESGSGKSVTAQAVLGLVELPGVVTGGDVRWKGRSLLRGRQAGATMNRVRGNEIAVVFQDPMTSLNPVFSIGSQLTEVTRRHLGLTRAQADERALELLDLVGIANPRQRLSQFPGELSGGMRQRVLIAMALSCEPELLIADEPTTALDVTIQAQILELIMDLQSRLRMAVLLITHDLGVVAGTCDRVAVMYAGRLAETAPAAQLFAEPAHPYTAGLLRSTPRLDRAQARMVAIDGSPPDMVRPPAGCPFRPPLHPRHRALRDRPARPGPRGSARCHPAGGGPGPRGHGRAAGGVLASPGRPAGGERRWLTTAGLRPGRPPGRARTPAPPPRRLPTPGRPEAWPQARCWRWTISTSSSRSGGGGCSTGSAGAARWSTPSAG